MKDWFGSLRFVQAQPWRLKYLTTEDLAVLTHEAEYASDDLTVLAVDSEVTRRGEGHREVYHEAYLRTHPKPS